MNGTVAALFYGVVSGLSEFLPLSGSGHRQLAAVFLPDGVRANQALLLMIELGAVLGVIAAYTRSILNVAFARGRKGAAGQIVLLVLTGALPSLGLSMVLNLSSAEPPRLYLALSFIGGGLVLLVADQIRPRPRVDEMARIPLASTLVMGLIAAVSFAPGVSRIAAVLAAGMAFRIDRRLAAEFALALGVVIVLGTLGIDAFRGRVMLSFARPDLLAAGFGGAFAASLVATHAFVFVGERWGFSVFAQYRIALGAFVLGLAMVR